MESLQYSIESDKTGFPMIKKNGWNFFISLFPVSNYQFERYLADISPKYSYTDSWYRERLEISPRCPWQSCDKIWQVFITGLPYEEILRFLKYLGRDFRLPKVKEWRALHESAGHIRTTLKNIPHSAPPVNLWLKKGLVPLTGECILEMVKEDDKISYIGKPHNDLLPNLWQPEETRIVNWQLCQFAVGFRVTKGWTK